MYKISVNIITYNRCHLLPDAIRSVLDQSFKDFELIIVDDGSTDSTKEIVSKFKDERIKYSKAPKQKTVNDVRNIALNLSQGNYIATLDDDDVWLDKDKLEKQTNFLDNNPDYILIGTGAIVIDDEKKEKYRFLNPADNQTLKNMILGRCPFVNSSALFRRDIAQKIGGYSSKPYSQHIEDYNFWLELAKHGRIANLLTYSVQYKEQKNQVSNTYRKKQTLNHLRLIDDYKDCYPNYRVAKLRSALRATIYGYLNMTWLYSLTAYIKTIKNKH